MAAAEHRGDVADANDEAAVRAARGRLSVRVLRGGEPEEETDLAGTTAAERIGMMWQLAQDAWAFTGEPIPEPGLSRHIVRVIRPEG